VFTILKKSLAVPIDQIDLLGGVTNYKVVYRGNVSHL